MVIGGDFTLRIAAKKVSHEGTTSAVLHGREGGPIVRWAALCRFWFFEFVDSLAIRISSFGFLTCPFGIRNH